MTVEEVINMSTQTLTESREDVVAPRASLVERLRLGLAAKVAVSAALLCGLLSGGVAGATTYDPTSDATTAASTAGTLAGPVIVAVFGGVVGLFVLKWAINYIRGILSARK